MASTDAMRERIAAHPWPCGGVEVIRANRGYTLYSQRTGGQVARLRPTVRMMTSGSCGGVARAGPRRATSDPSSCRSTRRSTSSPPRASSGSVLNLQSVTKCANSRLDWRLIGHLCLGYPELESERPELERAEWEYRTVSSKAIIRR